MRLLSGSPPFLRRLWAWLASLLWRREPAEIELSEEIFNADLTTKLLNLRRHGWKRGPSAGVVMPRLLFARGAPFDQVVALALDDLYAHARRHTTFSVPRAKPHVVVWPGEDIVGRFTVDDDGFVSITVGAIGGERPEALAVILAHEACHHILGLSGLRGCDTADNERLTDAAMFVCGFGNLYAAGRVHVRHPGFEAHLGYLDENEVDYANRWVAQQLRHRFAAVPARRST